MSSALERIGYILLKVEEHDNATFYTLVDDDYDGEYFSTLPLRINHRTGYVYFHIGSKFFYLHRIICRPRLGYYTDHINRIKIDNRSCNLREVTPKENRLNSKDVIRSKKISKKQKYQKKLAYNREWYKRKQLANK